MITNLANKEEKLKDQEENKEEQRGKQKLPKDKDKVKNKKKKPPKKKDKVLFKYVIAHLVNIKRRGISHINSLQFKVVENNHMNPMNNEKGIGKDDGNNKKAQFDDMISSKEVIENTPQDLVIHQTKIHTKSQKYVNNTNLSSCIDSDLKIQSCIQLEVALNFKQLINKELSILEFIEIEDTNSMKSRIDNLGNEETNSNEKIGEEGRSDKKENNQRKRGSSRQRKKKNKNKGRNIAPYKKEDNTQNFLNSLQKEG
ncbi:hypothetical protein HAX54_019227 [Datura stramonium]|uniref:Uncharacterized protein n=1 Tax=Datura stramonium TaxID=4076 RepID=A0ABS8UPG6_DATST|nr:hypothetical protein [Datura stramonium]